MRSPADVRRTAEVLLRAALLAALVIALWRTAIGAGATPVARSITASALARDLGAIARDPTVVSVALLMDAMPLRAERDGLVAIRRAGVAVSWHGSPPALAVQAIRSREPDAHTRILVTGDNTTPLALLDSAGLLDTVRAEASATIDAASVVGAVRVEHGRFRARASVAAAERPRAVLVLSRADWESKFVMQALSEAGWIVRARIATAPGVAVADEALLPLDTSRYDVVVALDSSAADLTPALVRFVAQGGGLVVGGSAFAAERLRALAPARAGGRLAGRILLADDSVTPRDLPLRPLSMSRTDALGLERQDAGASLVARRAGLGRVLAIGYDESWRWRMLGGMSGLGAHRRWWSSAAGAVASERGVLATSDGDAAPLASLVQALGSPSTPPTESRKVARDPLPIALMILVAACLLAETASRRFRGAR